MWTWRYIVSVLKPGLSEVSNMEARHQPIPKTSHPCKSHVISGEIISEQTCLKERVFLMSASVSVFFLCTDLHLWVSADRLQLEPGVFAVIFLQVLFLHCNLAYADNHVHKKKDKWVQMWVTTNIRQACLLMCGKSVSTWRRAKGELLANSAVSGLEINLSLLFRN